jgi:hypothetical protein
MAKAKLVRALTMSPDGVPYNTDVTEGSAYSYCGYMVYAKTPVMVDEVAYVVRSLLDNIENGNPYSVEEQDIELSKMRDFFLGEVTQSSFVDTVITEEPAKKTRVKIEKSPLFELLPQVFKGNGKVKKHPFNPKVKTANVRDVIRNAAKISIMTSVIIVLPVGTLQLSSDFKNLCVNSIGTSTFDLVLEEMMMMGWTIRGVNLTQENAVDLA